MQSSSYVAFKKNVNKPSKIGCFPPKHIQKFGVSLPKPSISGWFSKEKQPRKTARPLRCRLPMAPGHRTRCGRKKWDVYGTRTWDV